MTVPDLKAVASAVGMDFQTIMNGYAKQHIRLVDEQDIPYLRFRTALGRIEEGTVVFLREPIEIVRGFPKIRRALILKEALRRHMPPRFFVEEKLNGYNVRTVSAYGKIVSLTKGGIACPYTTEHIERTIDKRFFRDNSHLMLCGEVVGLQNPYQMKSYPEAKDFGYFIFDIRNKATNEALPIDKREAMLKKYGLTGVHAFGRFSTKDSKKLLKLVRKLGEEGREGIVIKGPKMRTQMKYTSNRGTNDDLSYAFGFVFDYGQSFFFRRLIREAFQCYELGLRGSALKKEAQKLGESILVPMVDTIRKIAEGKEVTEDFEITVPNAKFGEMFVKHLQHLGVKATVEHICKGKTNTAIKVKRHYPATNDKVKAYLAGEFCGE